MNYILLFLVAITTAPVSNAQCTGSRSSGVYQVSWAVSGGNVDFTVSVDTTEWVGVGFSLTANMLNSDIVVGATDGMLSFVEDRWVASVRTVPTFDTQQNLLETEINIQDGRTTMSFRRALVTTDNNNQDLDLNQCVYLLRAWGGSVSSYNSPASFGFHPNRGVFSSQLCLQDCVDTISSSSTMDVPTPALSSSIFTTSSSIVIPTPTQSPQCEGSLSSGDYEVSWSVSVGNVDFTVSVDTTGWVGIGFSLTPNMLNSDIVVGATDGLLSFVEDRWVASVRTLPTFDTQQNLENTEINIQDGRTTMSFRRALVTTDNNNQDLDLNQCVHLLSAWGGSVSSYNSPASFGFHPNRGVFSTQLCLQDCVDTISSSSTMDVPTPALSSSIFTTSSSIVIPTPTQSPQCEGSLSSGDYEVSWSVSVGNVDFTVSVDTTGWVGIGFSLTPNMLNSDIVVGATDGLLSFVEDRWVASVRTLPTFDTQQNLENTEINIQDGRTTMSFRRALVTTDNNNQDLDLNQCVYLLRAWGGSVSSYNSPASFGFHGSNNRGVFSTQLFLQLQDCVDTISSSSTMDVPTPALSSSIFTTSSSIVIPTPTQSPQCEGSLSSGDYEVSWSVSAGNVDFTVSVDTTGWVGIGFSLTPNMPDSDIVVGATDGLLSFVEDRWASGRFLPTFDTQQNLLETEINIQDGKTTMSFRRTLVTTDNNNQDLDLNQCVHLLRAWGGPVSSYNSPASFGYHGNNRGIFSTQLCLQDCVDTISSSSTMVVPTRTSSSSIFTTSTSIVTPTPTQSPQCKGSLSSGVYEVSWAVSGGNVDFTVSADTTEWVGVGFSLTANMPNSDIVVGATDGMLSFVEDRWVANQRIRPTFDTQQNLENTEINIQDGRTTMRFTRALITGDNEQDLDLNQCVRLLRAWGGPVSSYNSPASFGFHPNQGVFSTQLCLQDCVDESSGAEMPTPTEETTSTCTSSCNTQLKDSQYQHCCDSKNYGNFIQVIKENNHPAYLVCPLEAPDWCNSSENL